MNRSRLTQTLENLSASNDSGETVLAEIHRTSVEIKQDSRYGGGQENDLNYDALESSASPAYVAYVTTGYVSISISIVFFHRYLYTEVFPHPITATWTQQLLCSFALGFISLMHGFSPGNIPTFSATPRQIVSVIPLTIAFCGMTALGNLCLARVQVATYQVARSLTLPFTLALAYLLYQAQQSKWVVISALLVVSGFIVCLFDEKAINTAGAITGAGSSLFQASYYVLIKFSLSKLDNNENAVLFCNSVTASFFLLPLILIGGEGGAFASLLMTSPLSSSFWWLWGCFITSSALALCLTWFSYAAVQVTSPVAFNIMGIAKATLQTILGVATGDFFPLASVLGVVLRTLGSSWYSVMKHRERLTKAVSTDWTSDDMEEKGLSYGTTERSANIY